MGNMHNSLRHLLRTRRGSPATQLYRTVRKSLRLTQEEFGKLIGVAQYTVSHREEKRVYSLGEVVGLYEVSGLTPEEYIDLLYGLVSAAYASRLPDSEQG